MYIHTLNLTVYVTEYSKVTVRKRHTIKEKKSIFQEIYLNKIVIDVFITFFSISLYFCIGQVAVADGWYTFLVQNIQAKEMNAESLN